MPVAIAALLAVSAAALPEVANPGFEEVAAGTTAPAAWHFTSLPGAAEAATRVAGRLDQLLGADKAARTVFMGRIGPARERASGRSLRLPLERLIVTEAGAASGVR